MSPRPARRLARLLGIAAALALVAGAPATVGAHGLSPVYQSPLPLAIYLAGAAIAVALSFVFVLARDMRATDSTDTHLVRVPLPVRLVLRAIGLAGWAWILAQGLLGGSSDAAVAGLFLWVYGWVGIAMISALVAPVWEWIDPFATIHDILAWLLRTAGVPGWEPSELPGWARIWPAVVGIGFVIWLELVAVAGNSTLAIVVGGYTAVTLALMAQFGRDPWRAQGETFTVWFRTLNRLAPFGVVEDDATAVVRRPFASGLLEAEWEIPRIVLVAFATGSIIFDGLSQTVAFAAAFGAPGILPRTVLLLVFLELIALAGLAVARIVSRGAIGAGLLPISVGYLVAHYLTYLLIDGQRIVIAVSDPLQSGADLLGTAFFEPSAAWLPAGLVWTVQLSAVVGGHMLGAWAGHVTAQRDMATLTAARPARDLRHRKIRAAGPIRNVRRREIPLAVVMVALTTLTLWSLGQAIVQEPAAEGLAPDAGLAVRR